MGRLSIAATSQTPRQSTLACDNLIVKSLLDTTNVQGIGCSEDQTIMVFRGVRAIQQGQPEAEVRTLW
jgi:hypothetical protein